MGRLTSYMFTSLDGYIADLDGGLDWVPIDEELMVFANGYFRACDGIVFGRNVYDGFVSYWDHLDPAIASAAEVEFAEIFRGMQRIVASTTLSQVPIGTTLLDDDVPGAIAGLKDTSEGDLLLICGPDLRSALAEQGLIDRYRTLVAPVLLGDGVPLFRSAHQPISLRLAGSSTFDGGVVMLDHIPA
jgi:dihydrofolate reductase